LFEILLKRSLNGLGKATAVLFAIALSLYLLSKDPFHDIGTDGERKILNFNTENVDVKITYCD